MATATEGNSLGGVPASSVYAVARESRSREVARSTEEGWRPRSEVREERKKEVGCRRASEVGGWSKQRGRQCWSEE